MKKLLSITLTAVTMICFSSCSARDHGKSLSPEEEFQMQAKENARAYISEKYGVEAKVIDCEPITENTFDVPINYTPGEDAKVTMSNGADSFIVIISGLKETTDGKDSYQDAEIDDAVTEVIKEKIGLPYYTTATTFYEIDSAITDSGLRSGSEFYDGSNLKDMLYYTADRCIEVYDRDLSDESAFSDIIDLYSDTNKYFELCIVSYNDEESYKAHPVCAAYAHEDGKERFNKLDSTVFTDNSDKISSYRRYFADGTSEYVTFDKAPASDNTGSSSVSVEEALTDETEN